MADSYTTAAALREEILSSASGARGFIAGLFDEGTFLETGTYIRNAGDDRNFEGVITGCGAVNGRLVFAYIQDYSNGRGAFTQAGAEKITALYRKAIKAGAPVVGVFDSAGAKLGEGISALSGIGAVIAQAAAAKNAVPQVAVIAGACGGGMAAVASLADFVIADSSRGELYVLTESGKSDRQGVKRASLYAEGTEGLAAKTRELLAYLPENSSEGTVYTVAPEDINVPAEGVEDLVSGDVKELIPVIADSRDFYEISADFAKEMVCGFAAVNGKVVGVVANQPVVNGGALTAKAAKKAAGFVDFLGRFGIPVLTLVNSVGFGGGNCGCYAGNLADLASAYTSCRSAKVTVVTGAAYGSAFTLMGSKNLGADMVFALDSAVISVMAPETAVEFVWDDRLKSSADPAQARQELRSEWEATAASPLSAARQGDADDVIAFSELKQRIAAALEVF